MKIEDYVIVRAWKRHDMTAEVLAYTARGFEPLGPPFWNEEGYHQALVKPEEQPTTCPTRQTERVRKEMGSTLTRIFNKAEVGDGCPDGMRSDLSYAIPVLASMGIPIGTVRHLPRRGDS